MTGSRAGWNTEYVNLAPLGLQNRHSKIFNTIVLFVDQKKHLKTKVNQLLRRASTTSAVPEAKRVNGLEKVSLPTLRLQQALRSHPPNDDFIRTPPAGRRREEEREQGRFVPPMVRGEELPTKRTRSSQPELTVGQWRSVHKGF